MFATDLNWIGNDSNAALLEGGLIRFVLSLFLMRFVVALEEDPSLRGSGGEYTTLFDSPPQVPFLNRRNTSEF